MHNVTLPAATKDSGRIRLGGGVRIMPSPMAPAGIADSGRIRNGGGVRRA